MISTGKRRRMNRDNRTAPQLAAGECEALALGELHLDLAQLGEERLWAEPLLRHRGLLGTRSILSINLVQLHSVRSNGIDQDRCAVRRRVRPQLQGNGQCSRHVRRHSDDSHDAKRAGEVCLQFGPPACGAVGAALRIAQTVFADIFRSIARKCDRIDEETCLLHVNQVERRRQRSQPRERSPARGRPRAGTRF
jgi:hypothetical protein